MREVVTVQIGPKANEGSKVVWSSPVPSVFLKENKSPRIVSYTEKKKIELAGIKNFDGGNLPARTSKPPFPAIHLDTGPAGSSTDGYSAVTHDQIEETTRKAVEECNSMDSFFVMGELCDFWAGVSEKVAEWLCEEHPKKNRAVFGLGTAQTLRGRTLARMNMFADHFIPFFVDSAVCCGDGLFWESIGLTLSAHQQTNTASLFSVLRPLPRMNLVECFVSTKTGESFSITAGKHGETLYGETNITPKTHWKIEKERGKINAAVIRKSGLESISYRSSSSWSSYLETVLWASDIEEEDRAELDTLKDFY
ncbi:MAG: uncharacterized protein A8A55_2049 [Amphiamblys sp. WSBS2006]|nr:MAG: uncharacterized protein A8A55_2049 [Amphiamblys sp. WSBS2006]